MGYTILQWIGDEAVLNELVAGLPTLALIAIIVVCIALLSKGADWMIDGVVHLAERTRLPKIVIGATIVSLGTTAPEAFVSVMAAFMGNPGLALGNGVGSIIADTGLIFGLTCILVAVPVNRFILNRTGWVQVGSATLLVVVSLITLMASSGGQPMLTRWVGIGFLVLLAAYMYVTYLWARQSNSQIMPGEEGEAEGGEELMGIGLCWVCLIGGLVLVIAGARVLIPSASQIAFRLGVPDDIIAATLVAFGTSLPELITAITAVRKGHPEITVGNIVGADVLNCLFVIGAAATARPSGPIPPNFFTFHFPTMLIILYSFRVFISMNKDGSFQALAGRFGCWGIYSIYVILAIQLEY